MNIAEIIKTNKNNKLSYNENNHPLEKETRGQYLNRLKNES
jgi:hypothetical protein